MHRTFLRCEMQGGVSLALALLTLSCLLWGGLFTAPAAAQDEAVIQGKEAAQGAAETQSPAEDVTARSAKVPSTPLRIQGRVLRGEGLPLSGANVILLRQSLAKDEAEQRWRGVRPRVAASMTSGDDGRFELIAPDAGFWLLEVSLPGYATQRYKLTPLVDHAVLPDVTLPSSEGFSLQVYDAKGQPIQARFSAALRPSELGLLQRRFRIRSSSQWSLSSWEGRTDPQGKATLPLTRDGDWQVDVVAAGHEPAQVSLKGTTDVRLHPAAGRPADAVLANGRAAAGAYVYTEEGGLPVAKTDAEGRVSLSLSVDEHTLVWWHPSGQQVSSILPALDAEGEDGGEVKVHRAELEASIPATGRVLEARERVGLADAWVWAATDQGLLVTRSGGDGSYAFEVPIRGNAGIRAAASGYGMTIGRYNPPSPEETIEGIQLTLVLEPTAALQGLVVDAEGQPMEGVSARLVAGISRVRFSGQSIGAYRLQGLSDARGRLDFWGLTANQGYTLRLKKEGFAPAEFPVDALEAHEVRRNLQWTLSRGVRGTGQIIDQNDQPVAGAEVSLSVATSRSRMSAWLNSQNTSSPSHQTDREGRFVLPDLAPGRYDLQAKAPGYSRGVVRGLEVPEGGGEMDLGVLVLAPGVDLPGRVVDVDGVPLEGVAIMAFPGATDERSRFMEMFGRAVKGEEAQAMSGEDGRFVLEDRSAGDQLNVSGTKEGFIKGVVRGVTLPRDEPIEIVLRRASGISGRVVDADGSLLEGVTVTVVPDDAIAARRAQFGVGNSTATDPEGRFELQGVEPGRNGLRAQKPGFQTQIVRGFEVPLEHPLEGVELRLLKGAELTGSLKDADGEPVGGAMIFFMDSSQGMVDNAHAQTDGDGVFKMSGLPLGTFTVTASTGGAQKASKHITIEEGENTVELVFESSVLVAGQVVDANGTPVQGARITLTTTERRMLGGYMVVESASDGGFRFDEAAAGDYHLRAQKDGLGMDQLEEPLKVVDTAIEGLQLRFGGGARVVGRILGLSYDEMNRVQVSARGEVTQPNFEGVYRVDHVQPGDLRITARLSGSSRTVQEQVTIAEGEVEVNVDLEFADGYALTGSVYKMGQPADGLSLRLSKSGSAPVNATTDGDGRFRFEGLEEGDYVIRTSGWETSLQYEQEIELRGDEDIRIDLEVARLVGQVVDEGGRGIPNVVLRLEREEIRSQNANSDSLGQFDFGDISAGTWELSARRSGYAGETISVELEAGEVKDDVRLEMRAVRGILLDVARQDGRPMSSITVGFLGSAGPQGGGTLQGDNEGRFIVDTLSDGTWQMVLNAHGYGTVVQSVTAPREDPIRVVVQPEARLLVTVPALKESGQGGILKMVSSSGNPFYRVQWGGQIDETFNMRGGLRQLYGLTPGTWSVQVNGDDGSVWQGSVTVQAGEEATLELQ